VVVDDLVRGRVVFNNSELDDLIIKRTDGSPTYNLSVVVDDLDMGITQVIRGDDHLNNTPRQINILKALGAELPMYAHVPMILGDDGARLSKRHGAVSVMQYRDQGLLPEALLNYLVRLGWSHGDQEIFSIDEMVELFDLSNVNKTPSSFNTEKLLWINQHYIKESDPARVAHLLSVHMGDLDIDPAFGPDLVEVVKVQRERAKTLVELAEISSFYYKDFDGYNEKTMKKAFTEHAIVPLERTRTLLSALDEWLPEALKRVLDEVVTELEIGFGKLGMPLRLAITGGSPSPDLDTTLYLVGREATIRRIDKALETIRRLAAQA
jgi:glutamyl-tRNA synthetase